MNFKQFVLQLSGAVFVLYCSNGNGRIETHTNTHTYIYVYIYIYIYGERKN